MPTIGASTTVVLVVMLLALIVVICGPEPSASAHHGTPAAHGRASAYGPHLFGNKTGCGQKLRRRTMGVAHRTYACGTQLRVCQGNRCANVRVIDRGPFAHRRVLDITEGTTRRVWHTSAASWGVRTVTYRKGWR